MARVAGIISIDFTDDDATDHTLYATLAVSLTIVNDALEEAHDITYGWRRFFPGIQSWSAQSRHNEVIDTNGDRDVTQVALETLARDRSKFAITFTSAVGNVYTGTAWIRSLVFTSGDQQILKANVELVGAGQLTPTVNTAPEGYVAGFVADSVTAQIHVALLPDFSSWSVFLDSDPETIDVRDMWADYTNRILYWVTGTDSGTQDSGVYSAEYDPSDGSIVGSVNTLFNNGSSQSIRGLAVDVTNSRIYLTDETANRISWIPIAGGAATLLAGTYSNPNRLRLYLTAGTTYGRLDICLDGVGEIMRYDIDTETDLGTLFDSPGDNDYDEIDIDAVNDFAAYRRDGQTVIRANDYATYGAESTIVASTGASTGQIFCDLIDARLWWFNTTDNEIWHIDYDGSNVTDVGPLPTGAVAGDARFCLG